ncbi:uncharacterized protein LOC110717799 isoform X2 [Chenopodium quinoa]|uniref:uncharacterized protein LOC110717799 isoform X2 n=1 Tax=Chenopodium quinoa TaxID=63459 RepID=UPI000B783AD0|nr:uncharacterized protein LOC110717799 isoform X2 [Chenopodium quinoa]
MNKFHENSETLFEERHEFWVFNSTPLKLNWTSGRNRTRRGSKRSNSNSGRNSSQRGPNSNCWCIQVLSDSIFNSMLGLQSQFGFVPTKVKMIMEMSTGNGKRKCTMVGAEDEEGYGLSNKSNVCEQKTMPLYPELFKDDGLSYGGAVKGRAEVMAEHSKARSRPPNMGCRIESFGRICQKFDDRRRRWVCEMGFGSLLHLALDMHLPRQLAYWVMTRMDPISKMLRSPNGLEFRFSKNQVRWVLGIPMGSITVPSTKTMTQHDRVKVQRFILKYGKSWESKSGRQSGQVYTSVGIPLSSDLVNRLERCFDAGEEEEFNTLFLIIALEMVLCPT